MTVSYGQTSAHFEIDAIGPVTQIPPSVVNNLQAIGVAIYQLMATNSQAVSDINSALGAASPNAGTSGGSTVNTGLTGPTGSTGNS